MTIDDAIKEGEKLAGEVDNSKIMVAGSGPKQWDGYDNRSVMKDAVATLVGVVLTALAEAIPGVNFGTYTIIIAPVLIGLCRQGIRYFSNNQRIAA